MVKLTGFKNGIYVHPDRMAAMKKSMKAGPRPVELEEDFRIEDD